MKLLAIKLNNFRQFFGNQKIEFSTDLVKNVTVIHGENGSGKTALLNAFRWVFYGKTDFDNEKNLINERAVAEAEDNTILNMYVQILFNHDGKKYTAKRGKKYRKISELTTVDEGDTFDLNFINNAGQFENSTNPNTHIQQIVPEDLHRYFFFNGENIDRLAQSEGAENIKEAIKKLMGLEIVERASSHLKDYVIKDFRRELRQNSNSDLTRILDKEAELDDELDRLKESKAQHGKNGKQYRLELDTINNSLETKKQISLLQIERKNLEKEVSELLIEKESNLKARREYVSDFGYLSFTRKMTSVAKAVLNEKRKKGELPSKIKRQFVEDLLGNGKCICERELVVDSEAYNSVKEYLLSSIPSEVEGIFINTTGAIKNFEISEKELFSRLKEFTVRDSSLVEKLKVKNGRISEISNKIGKQDSEDIQKLEIKRNELRQNIEDSISAIGGIENQIEICIKDLEQIRKQREDLELQEEKAHIAHERLSYAMECKRVIDELYTALAVEVKDKLSIKVNDIFQSIVRKEFWAEIDDDYTLQIYKSVGDFKQPVYDKSTGENQITSLSFIGSIISLCKERYENPKGEYFKGGIYPIVMDSPFGTLDPEYRRLVAGSIPRLSSQVIVMLSESQWSGEANAEFKPKAGKEYTMIYNSPNIKEGHKSKSLQKSDGKYEFTLIKEGYYGR